jgi:hypothetical protein
MKIKLLAADSMAIPITNGLLNNLKVRKGGLPPLLFSTYS